MIFRKPFPQLENVTGNTFLRLSFLLFSDLHIFFISFQHMEFLIYTKMEVVFFGGGKSSLIALGWILGTLLPTLICQCQKGGPELLLAPPLLPLPFPAGSVLPLKSWFQNQCLMLFKSLSIHFKQLSIRVPWHFSTSIRKQYIIWGIIWQLIVWEKSS